MERPDNKPIIWTTILGIFYLVGIVGFSLDALVHLFKTLVPYNLLLTALVLFAFHRKFSLNQILFAMLIVFVSWGIEVIGTNTKAIFGDYTYGNTLGVKVLNTPLIIGLNWLILIYCTCCIAWRTTRTLPMRALTAAMLMVFIDIFIEPVATKYDYWSWFENDIPFQNYAMWFAISFVFSILFFMFEVDARNKIAKNVYLMQLIFFIALNLN